MTRNEPAAPARYVSFKEFTERTTLCRASVYNLIKQNKLPAPVVLTPRRVGWPVEVVDAWLAARAVSS